MSERSRMRESDIQRAVLSHWRNLGLPDTLVAAIPNQYAHGQYGLTKGLPDLVVVGPDIGVGFIELKTEAGQVTDAQHNIHRILAASGVRCSITFGRDEPIRLLEAWGIVRKQSRAA